MYVIKNKKNDHLITGDLYVYPLGPPGPSIGVGLALNFTSHFRVLSGLTSLSWATRVGCLARGGDIQLLLAAWVTPRWECP